MDTLGERIKKAREQKELTQEDLAKLINIKNRSTLASWEINRREPDYATLNSIATVLGVSVEWLLTGNGTTPPVPWHERDEPPTEADLEEIIESTPTLRLYGETLDEDIKDDLKLAFRVIWEQRKKKATGEQQQKK